MHRTLVQPRFLGLAVIVVVVLGAVGYAAAGNAYARTHIAFADRTLSAVISHQSALNATFTAINTQLGRLNSSPSFKPQDAVALVDKSVADSQLATTTIIADDASLAAAGDGLDLNRWLTMTGRSNLDHEESRIAHARNALAAARTVAGDKVLEGGFWHYLYTGLGDLASLDAQVSTGNLSAARTALATMKADIDQAAARSSGPPLPSDLASMMKDLQTFVTDYGKQLDAQIAGDDASVATYQSSVQADLVKVSQYDIAAIGTKIDAYYKPLIDRFNTEITAATS